MNPTAKKAHDEANPREWKIFQVALLPNPKSYSFSEDEYELLERLNAALVLGAQRIEESEVAKYAFGMFASIPDDDARNTLVRLAVARTEENRPFQQISRTGQVMLYELRNFINIKHIDLDKVTITTVLEAVLNGNLQLPILPQDEPTFTNLDLIDF